MVIFRHKLEVAEDNGHFGASDGEDHKYYQQEAEHVGVVMQPDGRHDEEHFNENWDEGNEPTKEAPHDVVNHIIADTGNNNTGHKGF